MSPGRDVGQRITLRPATIKLRGFGKVLGETKVARDLVRRKIAARCGNRRKIKPDTISRETVEGARAAKIANLQSEAITAQPARQRQRITDRQRNQRTNNT